MTLINSTTWQEARHALARAVALFIEDPNVSLIDLGYRLRTSQGNRLEPELAVRVHVRQKLYGEAFKTFAARQPHRVIDAERIGFAVDVPQAIYRLHRGQKPSRTPIQRMQFCHELCGGIIISNASGDNFGTLGGKVRDRQSGADMLLSNWHVLAGPRQTSKGAPICQPAREDEHSDSNLVAKYVRSAMPANLDAAVAKLTGQRPLRNEQLGIGAVTGVVTPQLGMRVIKSGGGTGVTSGLITGIEGYALQRYAGASHLIRHIVHIATEEPDDKISGDGDSGAWWLESSTLRAVALHFAGSDNPDLALALSMPQVLEALRVDIVTEQISPSYVVQVANSRPATVETEVIPHRLKKPTDKIYRWGSSIRGKNLESRKNFGFFSDEMIEEVEVEIIAEEPLALPQRAARSSEYLLPATTEVTPSGAFEILTPRLQAGTMRAIAQAGLLLAFCVATIGFSFHLRKMHHRQQLKVTQLQHHIQQLVVSARVDSVRRQSIEKVVTIMDRFNPQMPTDLKYRLASEIYEMSRKYRQLDVELICATISHETGHTWNPQAVSPAGAMGLMQILPSTGITLAQEEGIPWTSAEKILFDPIHNLRLGCRYLSMLVEAYTLDGGLAAYNGGMRNAELWMRKGRAKGILPAETASYVPSVLRIYKAYRRMSM